MALKAIWANKMRSMLTTLGIVIGTAAVIAVVSIVQGFSQVITNEVQNLAPTRSSSSRSARPARRATSWKDRTDVGGRPGRHAHVSVGFGRDAGRPGLPGGQVRRNDRSTRSSASSRVPGRAELLRRSGRFFSALDDTARTNACVIGHGVLTEPEAPANPIGRDLLVRGEPATSSASWSPRARSWARARQVRDDPFGTAVSLWGTRSRRTPTPRQGVVAGDRGSGR